MTQLCPLACNSECIRCGRMLLELKRKLDNCLSLRCPGAPTVQPVKYQCAGRKEALDAEKKTPLQLWHQNPEQLEPNTRTTAGLYHPHNLLLYGGRAGTVCEDMNYKLQKELCSLTTADLQDPSDTFIRTEEKWTILLQKAFYVQ